MDLYGPGGKPLKKKDTSPYYYAEETATYEKVPSMFDSKAKVFPYIKRCMSYETSDAISDADLEKLWSEAEAKKTDILAALEQLKLENEASGDTNKIKAYSRAIGVIKRVHIPIVSADQAIKLPAIGKGIAARIQEVVRTGKLRSLEERTEGAIQRQKVIEEFMRIWGVRSVTANKWYDNGRREIADLAEEKLDAMQKVGIKYLDEISLKIPRSEVDVFRTEIDRVVKKHADSLPGIKWEIAGSYRRGADDVSDVDVLLTGNSASVLPGLVGFLQENGTITDVPSLGAQKFMGIAIVPGGKTHRRMDIHYVPKENWGAGLLHFTGPGDYNRRMREQAGLMGYRLSEKGLFKVSADNDEKIKTTTEKDIYDALGMKYLEPKDRV